MSPRCQAPPAPRTTSTFSCDIAYSDSPTASRASASVDGLLGRGATLPSRKRHRRRAVATVDVDAALPSPIRARTPADDVDRPTSSELRRPRRRYSSQALEPVARTQRQTPSCPRYTARPCRDGASTSTRCPGRRTRRPARQVASRDRKPRHSIRRTTSTFSCDIARRVSRRRTRGGYATRGQAGRREATRPEAEPYALERRTGRTRRPAQRRSD